MEWFSGSNEIYEFHMFSPSHIIVLALFVVIPIAIFSSRYSLKEKSWRKTELSVAYSLIVFEILNQSWMYLNGAWTVGRSMPLELCNIGLILGIILLITKRKFFFEVLFFISLLGSTQAIITPALTYGFPHFRFFHFFYAHMVIVWISLYFLWVKGYYPSFKSVIKLVVFINLLFPFILLINKLADGNYWFLRHKPDSPSFLDLLGPYPWYIFSLESLLVALSLITYLLVRLVHGDGSRASLFGKNPT
jgi:hypothetical integral membrane protein (TIGR02206 family)